MAAYLLVANQTSGGEALATHLRRVLASDPAARFVVLVPVATPAPVDLGGAMGVMSGVAVLDPSVQAQIQEVAKERLARIVAWLQESGAQAEGSVVGEPLVAMEAAVEAQTFDEIIVSTVPARMAQWLRRDLPSRATKRFAIPITTVMTADPDPPPPASPAEPPAPASTDGGPPRKRAVMADSVYKIIELVGTSTESWEKAAAAAVAKASLSLRDLRVAEVSELDLVIDDGAVAAYRAKLKVSFKYEGED